MTPLNKTLSLMKDARAVIADPSKWSQWAGARDALGRPVPDLSPNAVSYCSIGILHALSFRFGAPVDVTVEARACCTLRAAMGMSISRFNDSHFHAEVLSKWDEAIAKLEAA